MRRSRTSCFAIALVLLLAAPAGAASKPVSREITQSFLIRLLEKGSSKIRVQPESCLSVGQRPPTVARELAAILAQFLEAHRPFDLKTECGPGPSPRRQFCTMSWYYGEEAHDEASAGFTFLADPQTGAIEFRTLECFQTP